jgi:hypothetical protein
MTANRLLDVLQRAHLAGILTEAEALAVVTLPEPSRKTAIESLELALGVPAAGARAMVQTRLEVTQ